MSEAYFCDKCQEFYFGYPKEKNGIYDFCPHCVEVMQMLAEALIDPMNLYQGKSKEQKQ